MYESLDGRLEERNNTVVGVTYWELVSSIQRHFYFQLSHMTLRFWEVD